MGSETNFIGHDFNGVDRNTALVLPCEAYELLDASSADAVPTRDNCRYFTVDADGLITIDYKDHNGNTYTETIQVYAGSDNRIRNITKLYHYAYGTTVGTAKSYKSKQSTPTTNAIKLRW